MRAWAALAFALLTGSAAAHDSWIVRGGAGLSLATGNRYPVADIVPPPDSVARSSCIDATGRAQPFGALQTSSACWVELHAFDIELEPRLVGVYLKEARPSDELKSRWQALLAEGRPWRERYRKFMRIEITGPDTSPATLRAIRQPAGLDLEIVPLGEAAFRAGAPARFAVLARGVPVKGLAVELVSDKSPLGVWSRSGAQGELEWTLPFAGRWLVRTIALEPDGRADWRSRFATLAFEAD